MLTSRQSIVLASLAAVIFAGIFISVYSPWALWLENDAGEYHALGVALTHGAFTLNGQPSMLREPGYPLFRSGFLMAHLPLQAILWAQALLYGAIVWLIGDAVRRIEPRAGAWAAWAAMWAYGLAIYATSHVTETLATTLASLMLWCMTRAMTSQMRWRWILATAVTLSALLLTRATFLFFIPLVAGALAWHTWSRVTLRQGLLVGGVFCAVVCSLILPWSLRNHALFGEWNIAGKSGGQVFIRAWKSELPGTRLLATYGSVIVGKSLLHALAPQAQPVILEQWDVFNARSIAAEQAGQPVHQFQRAIQDEALHMLRVPRTFLYAVLWTGVEELRLFALPSPITRSFSIESIFFFVIRDGGTLTAIQWVLLVTAHLIQLAWWGLSLASLWWGFRRYGVHFIPGWMILAIALAYAPADTIVRYGAPAHPWMLAAISWMLTVTWQERLQRARTEIKQ